MKKSLVALAALAASAAFAQSSVSIYGILDAGYANLRVTPSSGTANTIKGITSAGQSVSRLGFTGTEDLGAGLKANFTLEYYIEPDNGSGIGAGGIGSSARQAFVGLAGDFGSLNIGTQTTLIALGNGTADFNGGTGIVGVTASLNQNSRRTNMIQYTTPSLSGLTVTAQVGFAGALNTQDGNNTAVRAAYSAGPLNAQVAYETTKKTALVLQTPGTTPVADFAIRTATTSVSDALSDRKRLNYGVNYDLGVAKLGVLHSEAKAGSSADSGSFSVNSFGVAVPVNALTVALSMDNGEYVDSGATGQRFTSYQLGGYYTLSKRTNLYAIAGKVSAKGNNAGEQQYAVGVRHQF